MNSWSSHRATRDWMGRGGDTAGTWPKPNGKARTPEWLPWTPLGTLRTKDHLAIKKWSDTSVSCLTNGQQFSNYESDIQEKGTAFWMMCHQLTARAWTKSSDGLYFPIFKFYNSAICCASKHYICLRKQKGERSLKGWHKSYDHTVSSIQQAIWLYFNSQKGNSNCKDEGEMMYGKILNP